MRRMLTSAAVIATLGTLASGGSAVAGPSGDAAALVRLAESTMIVEVNATDGDAGLQVFLDGEPWRSMSVTGPDGRTILDVTTKERLDGYGLTELFSESSEPPFDVFPLAKFKKLFPAGTYTFSGRTIEGAALTGTARLSHDIPAGPRIVAPAQEARVGRSGVVARWRPGPQRAGVDIAAYRAIVTQEEPRLRVLSADLPASARQLEIPPSFFAVAGEYKLEVQAIERSGNQTLTEVSFRVR
jgi:hypothetical protein